MILDTIRSAYDRGDLSKRSFVETIGYDYDQEKIRRQKEADDGDEDLMYPQIITNQEEKGKDVVIPSKPKSKKQENLEDEDKKPGSPETKKFKSAELEDDLEIAPYKNLDELPKYIKKMTKHCQEVFMATFNSVYEDTGDEGKSFAIANSAARRCMKKQGYNYDKETKTWKKK
jgi:cation transport regulator ChaB